MVHMVHMVHMARGQAAKRESAFSPRGWGRALGREVTAAEGSPKLFYFLQKCYIRPMFETLPYEPRQLRATEDRLARIYRAAKLGLKGDNLALAAGMLPKEYARLKQFDEIAEYAELKGRAEGEMEMSHLLHDAAAQGDAKAALAILQNVHGWVAKQAISVDVNQSISITAALQEAERRVVEVIENNPSQVLQHANHTLQRAG
jgi:hypothetical protein